IVQSYTEALNLKPEEQYPKDQLLLVENLIAENLKKEAGKEEIEKAYKGAITEGDDYYFAKNYIEANAAYEKALSLKPEEKYPKDQIYEISKIFQTQKAIDEKYKTYITDADVLYKTEQYAKAKNLYKSALSIKPNEQYPKDQIVSIDAYFSSLDNITQQYNNTISAADDFFNTQDFNNARAKYEEASGLKPNEDYPKNQITEIDRILLSQKNAASEEQLRNEQYNSTISKAEQLFNSKEYAGSKRTFELALNIKPNETYPVQKIGEIDAILKDLKQQRKEYDNIIAAADKKFSSNKYNEAKSLYNNALNLFPEELYPKSKIEEIDLKLSALLSAEELKKAKEKEYTNNIRTGDSLFALTAYNKSKLAFEKALQLKPNEKYPKNKIDDILNELEKIKLLNEKYNTLIASADGSFSTKQYKESKTSYEKALELKPEEQYPKERLIEVNQKIAEQQKLLSDTKKLNEQYNNYITSADDAFKQKNYELAKTNYQSALNLKQNEQYPTNKIKEIEDIFYTQNQVKLSYKQEIEKADNYFNLKEYEFAKTYFEKALAIISTEQYPKDKINEIDNILDELKQKQKSYDKLIVIADKKYNDKEWTEAKNNYENALTILPNEEYPANRITEINKILDEIRLAKENKIKIEQGYAEAVAQADSKFNAGNYAEAKNDYTKALNFKPDESYPKSKIIEIDDLLEKEQKNKETTYNRAIASADSYLFQKKYSAAKSNYNKALNIFPDKEYPQLKLKEIDALIAQAAADEAKQAELDNLYNKTLSDANDFFKIADYVSAKASYQKALNYKPDATFPKKRLKEIEDLIKQQLLGQKRKAKAKANRRFQIKLC
ncbi:MAG: hypothetical protein GXO79_16730, partial [Chlorobi bacterium]|nr:hypothetical protein [Chlorobiota bacterium]